jgi:7-cyano-7-deazaguanine synthase in queuosine biosynthesis
LSFKLLSMLLFTLSQIDSKMLESESVEEVVLKTFVPMRDVLRVTIAYSWESFRDEHDYRNI